MFEKMRQSLPLTHTSRRDFMVGALAGGLSMSAASLLFSTAARATPKRGGVAKIALAHGSTSDVLDPAKWAGDFVYNVGFASNNFLTEIDVDGTLKGEVAEGWESNASADEWKFRLRQGVIFHDGRPVTAADVVASINHHRGEESTSPAKPLLASVKDVQSDGDNVVVFTLEQGSADFPFVTSNFLLPVKPANESGIDWQSGIGCGGYVLKEISPGVSASLERFDGYWKNDRAWFDAIEILVVLDATARSTALMTGQVDILTRPDIRTISRLRELPRIVVEEINGGSLHGFPMMVDVPPFDNIDVRYALKYAVDRNEMLQKILLGHGTIGNDNPIGPSYRYVATSEELPQRHYDPEQARFHLKKAGLDRLSVSIHPADAAFAGAIDAAVLYSEQAKQAGIDISVVRESDDGYWSKVWNVKPWSASYFSPRPTEDLIFTAMLDATAPWNETNFNHARFQKLLLAARSELDERLRREMYVEMQVIVRDEGGSLIPMFNNYIWARSEAIGHAEKLSNANDLDGLRWSERWWKTE